MSKNGWSLVSAIGFMKKLGVNNIKTTCRVDLISGFDGMGFKKVEVEDDGGPFLYIHSGTEVPKLDTVMHVLAKYTPEHVSGTLRRPKGGLKISIELDDRKIFIDGFDNRDIIRVGDLAKRYHTTIADYRENLDKFYKGLKKDEYCGKCKTAHCETPNKTCRFYN